jgi:hypothetical protein
VAPKVFATKQVIQIDGLASSSSPIIKARKAQAVMPQYVHPLNMKEEHTLSTRGEEITTPQAARASNFRVPGVHVHKKKHTIFH